MNPNWRAELIVGIDEALPRVRHERNRALLEQVRQMLADGKPESALGVLLWMRQNPQGDCDCRAEAYRLSGFADRFPPLCLGDRFWDVMVSEKNRHDRFSRLFSVAVLGSLAGVLILMAVLMWTAA